MHKEVHITSDRSCRCSLLSHTLCRFRLNYGWLALQLAVSSKNIIPNLSHIVRRATLLVLRPKEGKAVLNRIFGAAGKLHGDMFPASPVLHVELDQLQVLLLAPEGSEWIQSIL